MSENEDKTVEPHPQALSLPWYVNGSLSDQERRDVEAHLATCAACSTELASISDLREQTHTLFKEAPGPSDRARQAVMARIQTRRVRAGRVNRLTLILQELLAPKWLPAALMLVVVGQFAGLGWLATKAGRATAPTIVSRAVATPAVRLSIVFNPAVPASRLQNALRELGGHIVDGPTADGAFIIQLAPGEPKLIGARIRTLREQSDLVQSIQSAPP